MKKNAKSDNYIRIENWFKTVTLEEVVLFYTSAKTGKEIDLSTDVSIGVYDAIEEVEDWVDRNDPGDVFDEE